MSGKDGIFHYMYGGTSASRLPEEAEDTTASRSAAATAGDGSNASINAEAWTEASGFCTAAVSDETEAQRQSYRTRPGAYHVRPLAAAPRTEQRRSNDPEDSDAVPEGPSDAAITRGDIEGDSNTSIAANDATVVIDADVEAVAVPIDEYVSTYHAVPVVDALTTSRISEDGEEISHQLELGTSQLSDGAMKSKNEGSGMKNKYVIWSLASLLLVAVGLGLGLGLSMSRPQNSGNTAGNVKGADQDTSYHLVEMEISPQIESFSKHASSSVSLGLRLPTKVPGTFTRNLFVGWDRNDGIVKVYRSQMKMSNDRVSVGPFMESVSISLIDTREGNTSEPSDDTGSAIIVDGGANGQSFVVSYRNRVRLYSNLLHEAVRLCCQEDLIRAGMEALDKAAITEAAETLVLSAPDSFLDPSSMAAVNISDALAVSKLAVSNLLTWNQRGSTLACDDDPAIQGFGGSIGYSPIGPHSLPRLVVGSDSGHVRVYRLKQTNGTVPDWERLDGGLLDPGPDSHIGKAVVAMTGSGVRFAVGYPSLRKVLLYRFTDEDIINENSNGPNIELFGEINSEGGDVDMFGQALSLDILGNFVAVGAKGYARAYWLRVLPYVTEYVPAGNKISGEESDGEEFGSAVASGRVPHHSDCAGCPFTLNEQRIAISSPAYDNGRGRVLLYQYNEDEEIWQPLASPIEGKKTGERMGHDVRISPDMGSVVSSSGFGEVRTFRFQALQPQQ